MTPFELINHVDSSVELAMAGKSNLDSDTLGVQGFSRPRMRQLYNNLCAAPNFTYFEVGLWYGASFTAACCNNRSLTAFGVDNFAQSFGGQDVRSSLLNSLEVVRPKTGKLVFIEENCWTMSTDKIDQPVDLFLYDGEHTQATQRQALSHFLDRMADTFLFAVDDWNWWFVAKGTLESLEDLKGKVRVLHRWIWHTNCRGGVYDSEFHNGLALFLIQKL